MLKTNISLFKNGKQKKYLRPWKKTAASKKKCNFIARIADYFKKNTEMFIIISFFIFLQVVLKRSNREKNKQFLRIILQKINWKTLFEEKWLENRKKNLIICLNFFVDFFWILKFLIQKNCAENSKNYLS